MNQARPIKPRSPRTWHDYWRAVKTRAGIAERRAWAIRQQRSRRTRKYVLAVAKKINSKASGGPNHA